MLDGLERYEDLHNLALLYPISCIILRSTLFDGVATPSCALHIPIDIH